MGYVKKGLGIAVGVGVGLLIINTLLGYAMPSAKRYFGLA